jgi:hypothetical protein
MSVNVVDWESEREIYLKTINKSCREVAGMRNLATGFLSNREYFLRKRYPYLPKRNPPPSESSWAINPVCASKVATAYRKLIQVYKNHLVVINQLYNNDDLQENEAQKAISALATDSNLSKWYV